MNRYRHDAASLDLSPMELIIPDSRGRVCRSCRAELCVRRIDHDVLSGSNDHNRSAQKAAATMVDFFGHFDRIYP